MNDNIRFPQWTLVCIFLAASCGPKPAPVPNLANPASVYCQEQGGRPEIINAADGSQTGVCYFPDGSSCEEWAYFRGECRPSGSGTGEHPTALPVAPADYQGWWTYTHRVYPFSIRLPEDWVVEEATTSDPLMNGHSLQLHPEHTTSGESIRMTFRAAGESTPLWPTGAGQGEFVPAGTLEIAGQPAVRMLLTCPTGEVTSIWYQPEQDTPGLRRGDLEFGFIFQAAADHCQTDRSLEGKVQLLGEMIIASLQLQ
ncbi:MAG: DUF333 domain-containing protein [Anaerolineales bacterium]|nr:DUF333 domain-containing protein [Anaerolineales bacterium]